MQNQKGLRVFTATCMEKLSSPALDSLTRERMYFLIHIKLPVRERLFRFYSENDPYCPACLDFSGAQILDRQHLFCQCVKIRHICQEVKKLITQTSVNMLSGYSDFDFLTLQVPQTDCETELVWTVSTYVFKTWIMIFENEVASIDSDRMFGFLKFKYKMYQYGARPKMTIAALQNS